MVEDTKALSLRAKEVLSFVEGQADSEELLDQLESYMEAFSAWERRMSSSEFEVFKSSWKGNDRESFRTSVEELEVNHSAIVELVSKVKSLVSVELSELHKRGKALKTYTDQFPKRISVTGKRKG